MQTIAEAARALRAREVSASELTRQALDSIERTEDRLNAYVLVLADRALAAAQQADQELASGRDRGPLHGIPIALKDVFATKGLETNCASQVLAGNVPDQDSAVTERLSAAGAILVGKTNMHELAYGVTSSNPHYGPVHNPWMLDRIPGGSSGGSGATVAAGSVFMAMGSDTGGSIRIPAAYCGGTGIKPTAGRVSRFGVLPLDFSLDHMGPITRTVRDAAHCLQALAGYDPRDDSSSREPVPSFVPGPGTSLRGLRIGVPANFYNEHVEPAVAASFDAAVKRAGELGAELKNVRVPDMEDYNVVARVILLAEASAAMTPHLARRDLFGKDTLSLFDQGRLIAATDYVNAQRMRRVFKKEFGALFRDIDCLITPTIPITAPRIGQTTVQLGGTEEDTRLASTRFVRAINLLSLPALSIPCGFSPEGLPIGLQLIGRAFEEALLFQAGAALEEALGVAGRMPPL